MIAHADSTPGPESRLSSAAAMLILAALTLAAYGPALASRVHVATDGSLLGSPLLSWYGNLPRIVGGDFMIFTEGQYRPLSYALVAVLRTWVGPDSVVFWRVILLLAHLGNSLLVFAVARRVLRSIGAALAAGAVFAVHPLGPVVAGDPSQVHILAGSLLFLASAACYLRSREAGSGWGVALAVALYWAGMLACKVAAALPLFLLACELLRGGRDLRLRVGALAPFLVPLAVMAPVWSNVRPHPNFYSYPLLPAGTFWASIYTNVGTSGKYWAALLAGAGIPVKLIEVGEVVFSPTNGAFLAWVPAALLAAGLTVWAALKKSPAALGSLLAFAAFLPYANVFWNPVEEHVSLSYMYLPVAGLAVLVGALVGAAAASGSPERRKAALVVASFLVAFYGARTLKINWDSRTCEGYWARVLSNSPSSQTARAELGGLMLARGNDREAMALLFGSGVEDLAPSAAAACRAYLDRGEPVAALVHSRYVGEVSVGIRQRTRGWALARAYLAAGLPDYSEMYLGRILHANPYDTAAMAMLGKILLTKGYVRAAGRLADEALAIAPASPEARELRSLIAARIVAARAGADPPAVRLPPRDWVVYLTENRMGPKFRRAVIEAAEDIIADPVMQVEAAIALLGERRFAEALAVLDEVMPHFSPRSRPWDEALQRLYDLSGDDRFVEACRAAVEADREQAIARRALANALGARGEIDEAVALLREGAELLPGSVRTRAELGTALVRQGSLPEAVEVLRGVLEESPSDAVVRHNLATALLRWRRFGEAVAEYRKLLELDPADAAAKGDLAKALALSGRLDEAVGAFREAIEAAPGEPQLHLGLAVTLERTGDLNGAWSEVSETLRLDPENPVALREFGRLHLSRRRFVEAAKWLKRALAANPRDLDGMAMLADALFTSGRAREAALWRERMATLRSGEPPPEGGWGE